MKRNTVHGSDWGRRPTPKITFSVHMMMNMESDDTVMQRIANVDSFIGNRQWKDTKDPEIIVTSLVGCNTLVTQ